MKTAAAAIIIITTITAPIMGSRFAIGLEVYRLHSC